MTRYCRNVKSLYHQFRAAGYRADESLRSARIVSAFCAPGVEWDHDSDPDRFSDFAPGDDLGRVRIIAEPDEDYDWEDLDNSVPRSVYERCARDGAWGTVAQVWNGSEWEDVDSVWGNVGYDDPLDPVENCYVVDLMSAALDRRAEILASIESEILAWSAE